MEGVKVVRKARFWRYFEVNSTGFPNRLEVGGERKKGVKNGTQVFGLSI